MENKKGVQKFLGFINFYRHFVKNFSKIAGPLHELTGNNEWKWTIEQEVTFETLKEKISEEPVIAIAQANGKFRIEVDASGYAIGAVLSQIQGDGKWHPVAFLSRMMTPAEQHYEIYDKELLAIMNSITTWRQYLLGAKEPFEILTDHQNLTYFRKPQRLNQRQMGWYMKLQDYNFTMKHIPGKTNTKADILSCLDWYEEHIEEEEIMMLKDEFMINQIEEETTSEMIMLLDDMFEEEAGVRSMRVVEIVEFQDEEFEKQVKNDHHREDIIRQGLKKKDGWMIEKEGIVYVGGKIYIPPNIKLRERILIENHSSTTAGHPGIYKTDEMI